MRFSLRQPLLMLRDDGWRHDRTTGSHMMNVHPTKSGPVAEPAGSSQSREPSPTGAGRGVLCGKVFPPCAGSQHPQDAFETVTVVLGRTPAGFGTSGLGQLRFNFFPLLIIREL